MTTSFGGPRPSPLQKALSERPLPVLDFEQPIGLTSHGAREEATSVLKTFNAALASDSIDDLEKCFFTPQAYWRDLLAYTDTFFTCLDYEKIAAKLTEIKRNRGFNDGFRVKEANFDGSCPDLPTINVDFEFKITQPAAASCSGRFSLLPVKCHDKLFEWKIWIMTTRLEEYERRPEDQSLLREPSNVLDSGIEEIIVDVVIVGAGNSGLALAARLKAYGVDSLILEKKAQVGDNWASRYDSMKLHVPTAFTDMPFLPYDESLKGSHLLNKDELTSQLQRYKEEFNLQVVTSAEIESSRYDEVNTLWTIKFSTPRGRGKATAKIIVQATGIGSQMPRIPEIEGQYKGVVNIHSQDFKNGKWLAAQGVKSVLVIGSANTAFDVLQDCCDAGLHATMNVRSPTYVVPLKYLFDPQGLGAYNNDVDAVDRAIFTLPIMVEAHLTQRLLTSLASKEPDLYTDLAKAGFPVVDSNDPTQFLQHNILERAGGHYIDIGGTELIVKEKVSLKALVEPEEYTPTGLRFSDKSHCEVDAIVWCTGFTDQVGNACAAQIFGPEKAAELDLTWGLDDDCEFRATYKRQPGAGSIFFFGGPMAHSRFYSKITSLQIIADLDKVHSSAQSGNSPQLLA